MVYLTGHGYDRDSALLKNGAFAIKGTAGQIPKKAFLIITETDRTEFYLDKGKFTVTGDSLNTAIVKGGKTQAEYTLWQSQLLHVLAWPERDKVRDKQELHGEALEKRLVELIKE